MDRVNTQSQRVMTGQNMGVATHRGVRQLNNRGWSHEVKQREIQGWDTQRTAKYKEDRQAAAWCLKKTGWEWITFWGTDSESAELPSCREIRQQARGLRMMSHPAHIHTYCTKVHFQCVCDVLLILLLWTYLLTHLQNASPKHSPCQNYITLLRIHCICTSTCRSL